MSSPAIVIVPGACQTPEFYDSFALSLQREGFSANIVSIPSVGAFPGLTTFAEDVDAIKETLLKLTEQERDIILVMHSYGGIPGSAAAQGLAKVERKRTGTNYGISRLVYIASYALREGETIPGKGDYEGLKAYSELDEENTTMALNRDAAMWSMFHEISEEEADHWFSLLKPQSIGALWSQQTYAAWKDIPSTYVVCELDRVIPRQQQEAMIERARTVQPRAFDMVERIESGHEPIFHKVEDLVSMIQKAASEPAWS